MTEKQNVRDFFQVFVRFRVRISTNSLGNPSNQAQEKMNLLKPLSRRGVFTPTNAHHMKPLRLIFAAIICLVSIAVAAQETNSAKSNGKSRTEGLRKITPNKDSSSQGLTRIYSHSDEDWEDRADIDVDQINATVEAAVSDVMKSVDVALRHIDIPAVNVQLSRIVIPAMDMENIHLPEIEIPEIDIDIPEILGLEIDHDHFESSRHQHDHFQHDKEKVKDKDKEKTKGLKKIK